LIAVHAVPGFGRAQYEQQPTRPKMKKLFLTSIAALFLATGTAHADQCYAVNAPINDFVNLRKGPSSKSGAIEKLYPGTIVHTAMDSTLEVKGWQHVESIDYVDSNGHMEEGTHLRGWIAKNYLVRLYSCPEPGFSHVDLPPPKIPTYDNPNPK